MRRFQGKPLLWFHSSWAKLAAEYDFSTPIQCSSSGQPALEKAETFYHRTTGVLDREYRPA